MTMPMFCLPSGPPGDGRAAGVPVSGHRPQSAHGTGRRCDRVGLDAARPGIYWAVLEVLASPIRSAILSLILGLLGVVSLAWLSLAFEMPPSGASCHYELDQGSGPAGIGTEGIDWNYGLLPERECRYGIDRSEETDPRDSLFRSLWPFVAVVFAIAAWVFIRVVVWLARRLNPVASNQRIGAARHVSG
jgi:hypothetical protein